MTITAEMVTRPDSTYPVIIKPYKLDISQFGETVRDRMKFTISNVSEEDLSLKLVSIPFSVLSEINLPEMIEAGKSAEGEIVITKEMISEGFEKSFTFELSDEAKTRFTVPVKRTVKSPGASASTEDGKLPDAAH